MQLVTSGGFKMIILDGLLVEPHISMAATKKRTGLSSLSHEFSTVLHQQRVTGLILDKELAGFTTAKFV